MNKYKLTPLGKTFIVFAALIMVFTPIKIIKSKSINNTLDSRKTVVTLSNIPDSKEFISSIVSYNVNKFDNPVLSINYDINRDTIETSNYKSLNLLVNMLNVYDYINLEIKGYCSKEPNIENESFNQLLSSSRAENIKRYLISKGISSCRIIATGYGYSNPIGDNLTVSGRKMNRRTEIYLKIGSR